MVSQLAQKYARKVTIVGVGGLDTADDIRALASRIPHVVLLVDNRGDVWRHFGVTAQSTYEVIAANGEILSEGYLDDHALTVLVSKLAAT